MLRIKKKMNNRKISDRTTTVKLNNEYVKKLMKYFDNSNSKNPSLVLNELMNKYDNGYEGDIPNDNNEMMQEVVKMSVNQEVLNEFIRRSNILGYKTATDYIKKIIDCEENNSLMFGHHKFPCNNPWSIFLGKEHFNLALSELTLVYGDDYERREIVLSKIINQLIEARKGNESEIYRLNNDICEKLTISSPFENRNKVNGREFIEWLLDLIYTRHEVVYKENTDKESSYGLHEIDLKNKQTLHQFPRVFIVIDYKELTRDLISLLTEGINAHENLEHYEAETLNDISRRILFNLNIHLIISTSLNYVDDIKNADLMLFTDDNGFNKKEINVFKLGKYGVDTERKKLTLENY